MKKISVDAGGAAFITAAIFILRENAPAFFASALVHEVGHVLAAAAFGVKISGVRVAFGGAVIDLRGAMPFSRRLAISAAGPAASFIFAAALMPFFRYAAAISFALGAVNLLPVSTLDGAGVFGTLVEERFGCEAEEKFLRVTDAAALAVSAAAAVYFLALTRYNASALVFAAGVFARLLSEAKKH